MTLTFSAQDPEEMEEVVSRGLGWTVQLRPDRRFGGEITARAGARFAAITSKYAQSVRAFSPDNPPHISFLLIMKGFASPGPLKGRPVFGDDGVLVLNALHLNFLKFLEESETIYLTAPMAEITSYAHRLLGPDGIIPFGAVDFIPKHTEQGHFVFQSLCLLNRALILRAEDKITAYALSAAEEATMSAVLSYVSGLRESKLESPKIERPVVRRAAEIVKTMQRPLQVSELAECLGVSIRSMQLGFLAEFGVSPHVFLKQARLSAVRSEVIASQRLHVQETVKYWGFSNVTRFRADYVKFFGLDDWKQVMER